jgi:Luciferase-like monooxygenase
VADPEASLVVKVGVLLPRQPADLGEWLAEATAFEAAGADALWVDLAPGLELDPLAVTAALAAVTYRSLLVSALPTAGAAPEAFVRTVATIGKLSRGRFMIISEEVDPGAFRRVAGQPGVFELVREDEATQRWASTPAPESRATWRTMLVNAARDGCHGLVVPADRRLLDILRNPGDSGDRRDLQLAVG